MNQRINWIDSAKGIGILLVVLGHSTGNIEDPLNKAILSFHMPLFFFLSGLCSKQKEENKGKQALRKAYSLLLPNITLGILLAIIQIIRGGEYNLLGLFTGWFLLTLFYVQVIFIAIQKYLSDRRITVLLIAVSAIATWVMQLLAFEHQLDFEKIPVAFTFFLIGHLFKSYLDRNSEQTHAKLLSLLPLSIPLVVILSSWNSPVTLYNNGLGNIFMFFACALVGIYGVCSAGFALKNNTCLQFLGRNSIIIYVIHFTLLGALHVAGKHLLPNIIDNSYGHPANWIYFLLTVIVIVPCIWFANRFCPWLFGKHKSKKSLG